MVAGATATINFLGTGFGVFGVKRDNRANFSAVIDDQPPWIGSAYEIPFRYQISLWHASDLEYTMHTVTLTNIPLNENLTFMGIDFIEIERQIGGATDPIFNTTLEDTSKDVKYTGVWNPVSSNTASNNTMMQTSTGGAQVMIPFQGCCLEIYGQYANANYTVSLDGGPLQILTGFDLDLIDSDQQPKTLLYLVDNLDETEGHSVTVTNLDSLPNRPLYFDYATVLSTKNFSSSSTSSTTTLITPTNSANPKTPLSTKSMHIGAIIGGAVGGVAFLFLLGILGLCLWRRHRRQYSGKPGIGTSVEGVEPFILPPNNIDAQVQGSRDKGRIRAPSVSSRLREPQALISNGLSSSTSSESTPASSTETRRANQVASSWTLAVTAVGTSTLERVENTSTQGHPVQETDAGGIDINMVNAQSGTLPPAYNSSWNRQ
ncbi:hypothetical protein M422DRAFT_774104 [Sphaerobolus stellatus SS14]|nr:hypothetical protein M422DRAFT_774104 [Sphaerobolus stellatus SS14]